MTAKEQITTSGSDQKVKLLIAFSSKKIHLYHILDSLNPCKKLNPGILWWSAWFKTLNERADDCTIKEGCTRGERDLSDVCFMWKIWKRCVYLWLNSYPFKNINPRTGDWTIKEGRRRERF